MSNIIHIILEAIGVGTLVTLALVLLSVLHDKLKRISCDHVYRLTTIIGTNDKQIVCLECKKCGELKEIVIDASEVQLSIAEKVSENA